MTIFVQMTAEDVAKKWLAENSYVAVKWDVMEAIINKKTGNRVVVFDQKMPTFLLMTKAKWRKQFAASNKKLKSA